MLKIPGVSHDAASQRTQGHHLQRAAGDILGDIWLKMADYTCSFNLRNFLKSHTKIVNFLIFAAIVL